MTMEQNAAGFINNLKFNQDGLIVAIAQDLDSKDVLMQAWMNQEAILKTIETGQVTYFSRSRNALWTKGEASGNSQTFVKIQSDCDGDSLLITVKQKGPACHTDAATCFKAGEELKSDDESI